MALQERAAGDDRPLVLVRGRRLWRPSGNARICLDATARLQAQPLPRMRVGAAPGAWQQLTTPLLVEAGTSTHLDPSLRVW
jgi:hypothetical protein